jgi:hypothetical protein
MVELSAIADDDVGVTLVEFLVDGAITIGLDATAPYTITWDSSTTLGHHLLTIRAYDHGHNVGVYAHGHRFTYADSDANRHTHTDGHPDRYTDPSRATPRVHPPGLGRRRPGLNTV